MSEQRTNEAGLTKNVSGYMSRRSVYIMILLEIWSVGVICAKRSFGDDVRGRNINRLYWCNSNLLKKIDRTLHANECTSYQDLDIPQRNPKVLVLEKKSN